MRPLYFENRIGGHEGCCSVRTWLGAYPHRDDKFADVTGIVEIDPSEFAEIDAVRVNPGNMHESRIAFKIVAVTDGIPDPDSLPGRLKLDIGDALHYGRLKARLTASLKHPSAEVPLCLNIACGPV
jgi:hypothetical protein